MSKRDVSLFFGDILEAIERISNYTDGVSQEEFCNDQKTIDAVVRNIEIIGEAAANIPDELRYSNSHIPWKKIVGARNIVIHKYFGVDTNILWNIIKKQLPPLKSQISEILHQK